MSGYARGTRAAGGVALAVVARDAAEQFVHGQAERLALDVPQREIQRAEGVRLLAPRRVEPGDVGLLPDPLDVEGVLADERARHLLEGVLRAALADAGDADVGLDGHHHVALVEQRVEIGRTVDPHAGDLRLGQRRSGGSRPQRGQDRRRRHGGEECSSIDHRSPHASRDSTRARSRRSHARDSATRNVATLASVVAQDAGRRQPGRPPGRDPAAIRATAVSCRRGADEGRRVVRLRSRASAGRCVSTPAGQHRRWRSSR